MQTSYLEKPVVAMPGMLADLTDGQRIRTGKVMEAAGIPFGIFVKKGAAEGELLMPAAGGDKVCGIALHTHYLDPTNLQSLTGIDAVQNDVIPVLEKGLAYMVIEEDVAEDDPVYVRVTANGAGKLQLGAVRNDADAGNCILVKGASFRRGSTFATDPVAVVAFDLEASRT